MEIIQDKKEKFVMLSLKGRLDTLFSKSLETKISELIAEKEHNIIIDLSQLDFISSSGLRVLLSTAKQLNRLKGKLALCNLNDRVKEVFDVSGFTMLFSMYPSSEEAYKALL